MRKNLFKSSAILWNWMYWGRESRVESNEIKDEWNEKSSTSRGLRAARNFKVEKESVVELDILKLNRKERLAGWWTSQKGWAWRNTRSLKLLLQLFLRGCGFWFYSFSNQFYLSFPLEFSSQSRHQLKIVLKREWSFICIWLLKSSAWVSSIETFGKRLSYRHNQWDDSQWAMKNWYLSPSHLKKLLISSDLRSLTFPRISFH